MGNTNTEDLLTPFGTKLDVKRLATDIEAIKIQFNSDGLALENAPALLLRVMEDVNRYRKLSGHEKKRLVVRIMGWFIDELCPGEKTELEAVLKQMIPPLIDSVIHAGKMNTFRKRFSWSCIC